MQFRQLRRYSTHYLLTYPASKHIHQFPECSHPLGHRLISVKTLGVPVHWTGASEDLSLELGQAVCRAH
jgi:hypothetical protein